MTIRSTAENPVARMALQAVIGVMVTATLGYVVWLGTQMQEHNAHLSRLEMRVMAVETARLDQRMTVLETQRASDREALAAQMVDLRRTLEQVGQDMRGLSTRLDTLRYGPELPRRSPH